MADATGRGVAGTLIVVLGRDWQPRARHKVTYYVTTFIFNQTNVESPIYTYTAPLLLLILLLLTATITYLLLTASVTILRRRYRCYHCYHLLPSYHHLVLPIVRYRVRIASRRSPLFAAISLESQTCRGPGEF